MSLVHKLQADYPTFTFTAGDRAHWSPRTKEIFYVISDDETEEWAALHELGHALLNHTAYETDIALLKKEVEAWAEAERVARNYGRTIDSNHIEDCLDTYRNWLHARSTCPKCYAQGIQSSSKRYNCINCASSWLVSSERSCRAYRRLVHK